MNKQKNISSTVRSLGLNGLYEPSVFTGKLEMKTEDEVDFLKDRDESAAREEVVSDTYALSPCRLLCLLFPLQS